MKKIIAFTKNIFNKEGKKIFLFSLLLLLSIILWRSLDKYLVDVPSEGGKIAEIQIGTNLRFVNPVLANSNAEKDLLPLIYSPILKKNDEGEIIPGIAQIIKKSEDEKKYTIKIQEDIFFSDGEKLDSDDVIFTIKKISDPELNSPYYANWIGVEYEKINEHELKIILPEEYNQFEEILSSLYILPKNLWENFSPSEFEHNPLNINAIGSGPYIVKGVMRSQSGKIKKYELEKNEERSRKDKIFIDEIIFHFFDDYKEYQESIIFSNKKIIKNISNVNPDLIHNLSSNQSYIKATIKNIQSPKIFGLFLNKNSGNFLKNKILRKSISKVVDKNRISDITLKGYAKKVDSPIFNLEPTTKESDLENIKNNLKEAGFSVIEKDGTSTVLIENRKDSPSQPVILTMKTIKSDEFIKISNNIKQDLSKIGITLNILYYDEGVLANTIIRNRDFEILLFGYQININPDLFYFFHSSQISDPGINISGVRSTQLDKNILELRKNLSKEKKLDIYKKINKIILEDYSFIPIYSPYFVYIMDSRLQNFNKKIINSREERFSDVSKWYTKTKKKLP